MTAIRKLGSIALTLASVLWLSLSWATTPPAQTAARPAPPHDDLSALADVRPGTVESTYKDGNLTVKARNAPLTDVLHTACDAIGAQLDMPEDAVDPVLRAVGPGAPREVLASLLNSSHYGYSISGSRHDSKKILHVALFPRDKSKDGRKDKDPEKTVQDERAAEQRVSELLASAGVELPDIGDQAGEGDGSSSDNGGGGNGGGQPSEALAKALQADPSLLTKVEARVNGSEPAVDAPIDYRGDQASPPLPPGAEVLLSHRRHTR